MENSRQNKLKNVPNILSIIRMVLVPFCIASILYTPNLFKNLADKNPQLYLWVICLIPIASFGITSLTDMLDGKIARKYNLVSNFGKFIDPLADKFMVFGMLIAILCADQYAAIKGAFVWVSAIVMLRELGVTSLRLVVASKGVVVAASFWGKLKTVTQIASLIIILLEPAIIQYFYRPEASFSLLCDGHLIACVAMAAIIVTTVGSGMDYMVQLWPYLTEKGTDKE